MSSTKKQVITWADISSWAYNMFNVWVSDGQHRWAEYAWNFMVKAGLADYKNEIERHIVMLRLITLGIMYREFCEVAFDEHFDIDSLVYEDWLDNEDFCRIRIWQLVGREFLANEPIEDEDDMMNYAIIRLTDELRDNVYRALRKGFGDDLRLFISMYLTCQCRDDGSEFDCSQMNEQEWADLDQDLNYDTFTLWDSEGRALQWIHIGMPRSPLENI